MKPIARLARGWFVILAITTAILLGSLAQAQDANFHNAPASSKELKNPYEGREVPNAKALFHLRCARCHGENGEGSGNIPPLNAERIKTAASGEIFWFITQGDVPNGMPSWAKLPSSNAGRSSATCRSWVSRGAQKRAARRLRRWWQRS